MCFFACEQNRVVAGWNDRQSDVTYAAQIRSIKPQRIEMWGPVPGGF